MRSCCRRTKPTKNKTEIKYVQDNRWQRAATGGCVHPSLKTCGHDLMAPSHELCSQRRLERWRPCGVWPARRGSREKERKNNPSAYRLCWSCCYEDGGRGYCLDLESTQRRSHCRSPTRGRTQQGDHQPVPIRDTRVRTECTRVRYRTAGKTHTIYQQSTAGSPASRSHP